MTVTPTADSSLINKQAEALQLLKNEISGFCTLFEKLGDKTRDSFSLLWPLRDGHVSLKPLLTVTTAAKEFSSIQNPASMSSDLGNMKTDVDTLKGLLESSQNSTIGESLTALVKSLSSNKRGEKTLTNGLTNGISDIEQIFKDLKGQWLKKNIGNGGSIEKVADSLKRLEGLVPKWRALGDSWSKLANNETSRRAAEFVSGLLIKTEESSRNVKAASTLSTSFGSMQGILKNLKPIVKLPDQVAFEALVAKYEPMNQKIAALEAAFDEIAASEVFKNLRNLEQIATIVGDPTTALDVALNETNQIRGIQDAKELNELITKVTNQLMDVDLRAMGRFIDNEQNWALVEEVQKSLDNTDLVNVLENIQKSTFDKIGTASFVSFASDVRAIKSAQTEVTGTKTFLADLSAVVTAGKAAKSSSQLVKARQPRQTTPRLDSHVAHQLGSAVQILQNMAVVSEKKGKILGLANAKASVTTAVVAVAKDMWTAANRDAMKNTVDEVEKLEKYVQKLADDDWNTLVKVFDEAAKVKGVPIDSKTFGDPIGVALEKSTDSDVKAAAVDFRDLSTLDLDFASKERDLKTASLTLNPIRDFFDQLLGISRAKNIIQTATQEPVDLIWYYVGTPVGAVLLVVLTLVATWIYWLRREKKWKERARKEHEKAVQQINKANEDARKDKEDRDRKEVECKLLQQKQEREEVLDKLKNVRKEKENLKKKLRNAEGQLVQAQDQAKIEQEDKADKTEDREAEIQAGLLELNRGFLKVPANRMAFFLNHAHELRGAEATKSNCIFKAVEEGDHDNLRDLTNVKGLPLDTFHFHDGEYKTALMLACEKRDSTAMHMLLEAGANAVLIGSQRLSAERILERNFNDAKQTVDIHLKKTAWLPMRWVKKKKRDGGSDPLLGAMQGRQDEAEKMLKDLQGYQNEDQVQKSLPDFLPIAQYLFAIVDYSKKETDNFIRKFSAKIHKADTPTHTHRISPTDVYEVEPTIDSLTHLLEPQPLLKPSYMTACLADPNLLGDDYMYRVTDFKWKDETYDTVETIKYYTLGHMIPQFFGSKISYFGDGNIDLLVRLLGLNIQDNLVHMFVYDPNSKDAAQQKYDQETDTKTLLSLEEFIESVVQWYQKLEYLPTAHKGPEAEIKEHIEADKRKRHTEFERLMEVKEVIDRKNKNAEKAQLKRMEIFKNQD